MVAQTACYFIRICGHDIMLAAKNRTESSTRAFARGQHLNFEYRCADTEPLSALSTAVLEGFTLKLLRQEARIAETLRMPNRSLAETTGINLLDAVQSDGGEVFKLMVGKEGPSLTVAMGPPEANPLPLFRWSFRVTAPEDLPLDHSGTIQHFMLLVCAHRILEEPLQNGTGRRQQTAPRGREVFAYFAPARPDHPVQQIPELQAGDRLRLSFEVPTRCSQQCVFCVAWNACDNHQTALDTEDLLAAASRLAKGLTCAEQSASADVVLVGQDALTHPGFASLVRLFRSHPGVERISVVTPGTGLARPELAMELADAGLNCVILTLLSSDPLLHDRLAGRAQAHADFLLTIRNLAAAEVDWELNTVVLKDNLDTFPGLLEYVATLGCKLRVYLYTNEPMVPLEQVALCAPDPGAFAAMLEGHRRLVEASVESIHYAPLCLLPRWAWRLSGHASQSLPTPAVPPPEACQGCAAQGARCPSVSAAFVSLFGTAGLVRLDRLEE